MDEQGVKAVPLKGQSQKLRLAVSGQRDGFSNFKQSYEDRVEDEVVIDGGV